MNRRCPAFITTHSSGSLQRELFRPSPAPHLKGQNKENTRFARNDSGTKEMVTNSKNEYLNQKEVLQAKDANRNNIYTKENTGDNRANRNRPISAEIKAYYPKNSLANRLKQQKSSEIMAEVKSNRSRKKSVRFSDDSVDLKHNPSVQQIKKSEIESKPLTRSRSNSILKNKGIASLQTLEKKCEILLKSKEENLNHHFSINQYKNTLIRQRYSQLLKSYTKRKEAQGRNNHFQLQKNSPTRLIAYKNQYTDNNFTPSDSSLFRSNHPQLTRIKWLRISQLFKNKQIAVTKEEGSNVVATKQPESLANANFIAMVNLLRSSKALLRKIFQNSTYNQTGIYMLKIFIAYEWKCIIIDDLIPAFEGTSTAPHQTAFTSLTQLSRDQSNNEIQIWPLLLEKAYASALGCYQAVHQGSLNSYFCQMMGIPLHKISIKSQKSQWKQEIKTLANQQFLAFSYSIVDKQQTSGERLPYRVKGLIEDKQSKIDHELLHLQEIQTKLSIKMTLNRFQKSFQELFAIKTSNLEYFTSVSIAFPSFFGRAVKSKTCFNSHISFSLETKNKDRSNQIKRVKPIVKTFSIRAHDEISLILKRRNPAYDNSIGKTLWIRAFLFMKELDSYRWIEAKYDREVVTFCSVLEPGEYFVVILPDWISDNFSQMTLLLYSRVNPIIIQSYNQNKPEAMIEKGCSDYAQRFGKMIQVNRFICTYAIVDAECGIVIENINNERRNGKVKIYRSIANLKPQDCFMLPLNEQFYAGDQVKPQVEISLDKDQSYSVILMLFGGRDNVFLNTFNFGV